MTMLEQEVYEAVARSLREFGYPDATAQMVHDTHTAMVEGKSGAELPHGIVGRFAESQLKEAAERGLISLDAIGD